MAKPTIRQLNQQRVNPDKVLRNMRYSNYPVDTAADYANRAWYFVNLAFEAYAAGKDTLGDIHAACAERRFMEADLLRGKKYEDL